MLSFKPAFSLSSFTFINRLFSSSSLSAFRVVSSAYLRMLIFLLAIMIPACDLSSPAFHMMCFAYKLKKQGNNIQTWQTPFPILNHSIVPCLVLTIASLPTYRFLKRQVRCSGIPISFRIFHNPKRWCCGTAALNMPENLENSAVATGLEKVNFHSNPKERQCHRMLKLPHNCIHLTG